MEYVILIECKQCDECRNRLYTCNTEGNTAEEVIERYNTYKRKDETLINIFTRDNWLLTQISSKEYKFGSIFSLHNELFILCNVKHNALNHKTLISMISLEDGCRWSDPITISESNLMSSISAAVLKNLIHRDVESSSECYYIADSYKEYIDKRACD